MEMGAFIGALVALLAKDMAIAQAMSRLSDAWVGFNSAGEDFA